MNEPKRTQGLTLLELLVGMAILGVLMLAFTQVFGGSLRASGEINARNELLNEGQIAQQLIASRLQSAYFIYPPGTTLQLTVNGGTTQNTVRAGAGQNWLVGTDPFVAMLLPPTARGQCPPAGTTVTTTNRQWCFTFYAYYPVRRGALISSTPSSAPPANPNNENIWVLMEYRANIFDGVNRSADQLANPPTTGAPYTGRSGQMLVDYVQPQALNPSYTMFRVCIPDPLVSTSTAQPNCPSGTSASSPKLVDVNLRFLQNSVGKAITAPAGTDPLSTRVYPRNLR